MTELAQHPAKFSALVLGCAAGQLYDRFGKDRVFVVDPFAGIGGVHQLSDLMSTISTVGVEIEPEFAVQHPNTVIGTALDLPFAGSSIDAVVTSPCYGNRMADQYLGDPRGSARHTYAMALGRRCATGSAAAMQWGVEYRRFHLCAAREMRRVVRPGGVVILNVSDHIRGGVRQEVEAWWTGMMVACGFRLRSATRVPTRRQRHGANGQLRVDGELVAMFETGDPIEGGQ